MTVKFPKEEQLAYLSSNFSDTSFTDLENEDLLQQDSLDKTLREPFTCIDDELELLHHESWKSKTEEAEEGLGYWMSHLPDGLTFFLLRFPFLISILLIVGVELTLYFLLRLFITAFENLFYYTGKRRKVLNKLQNASTYKEWLKYAQEMDHLNNNDSWKKMDQSGLYDYRLIKRVIRILQQYRQNATHLRPIKKICRLLLEGPLKGNFGGIDNPLLYSKTFIRTKQLIYDYHKEILECLNLISNTDLLTNQEKKLFFQKAYKTFGQTVLCLSGGATFGYFHFGVIKALLEHQLLPDMISGTSAGSLIAAFTCVRNDAELKRDLNPDLYQLLKACSISWMEIGKNLYREQSIFSPSFWLPLLTPVTLGPSTFQSAFEHSQRELFISVSPATEKKTSIYKPTLLLSHHTAPQVLIGSAVLASSAIPGLLPAIELKQIEEEEDEEVPIVSGWGQGLKWRDGSLKKDVGVKEGQPLEGVHVRFSIVSQVNPHIICFLYQNQGTVGEPTPHRLGKGWRGGFLGSYLERLLKLDLLKWVRVLRDLHLLPMFCNEDFSSVWLQNFEGSVTLIPRVSYSDYFKLFKDPDGRERMQYYIRKGEQSVFPKLERIRIRKEIESFLKQKATEK